MKQHPYRVVRTDFDDGCIAYEIWDESPESYRRICSTYEADEIDRGRARRDADLIARALNALHRVGKWQS